MVQHTTPYSYCNSSGSNQPRTQRKIKVKYKRLNSSSNDELFRLILVSQAGALLGCLYEGIHRPHGAHVGASNAMLGLAAANIADMIINCIKRNDRFYKIVLRILGVLFSVCIVIGNIGEFIDDQVKLEPSNIS